MVHGEDVGFAGTAGERSHGEVDDVRTGRDSGEVAGNCVSGGIMGVELDLDFGRKNGSCLFDGFIDGCSGGGTGSVFESNRIKGNAAINDLLKSVDVELGSVGIGFGKIGSKTHHGNGHLMFETVFCNGAAGNFQVADVIESVKVTDGGDTVFLEEFCMKIDDIAGLGGKTHNVHTAGEGLQVHIGTHSSSPEIHHFKGIFLAVEIQTLETGAAADFNVGDPGIFSRCESRKEIFSFYAGSEAGLKTVSEGAIHKFYFFHKK